MIKNESGDKLFLRLFIFFILIGLPLVFLSLGVYGSFLFTFSIPLFWQVIVCKEPVNSLGLTKNRIRTSMIAGVLSGCVLGLLGGNIIKIVGATGYSFTELHKLQWSLGSHNIAFSLQKEAGCQLLTKSGTWLGLLAYFVFSVFAIGLGEELFWRGFIQRKILQRFSMNLSVWITAILFALIHFYLFQILSFKIGILFLVILMLAGVCWGYLFQYFKNIWVSAMSHGIASFIIWKYYFFVG